MSLVKQIIEQNLGPLVEPLEMEENPQLMEITIKEYAWLIIGTTTASIQLGEVA